MSWELFVALKYLTGRRREGFISLISLISILGIAVGVGALIIVIAVMSGFDNDLKDKIIGIHSHLVVESESGIDDADRIARMVQGVPHALAAAPYIHGQAILKSRDDAMGVIVKGIDPAKETGVSKLGSYIVEGDLNIGEDGIAIGAELAARLKVKPGDSVTIISHAVARGESLKVRGVFMCGMYDYDLNLTYVGIKRAQKIFGMEGIVNGISVKADDALAAASVKAGIQKELQYPYIVRTWMDSNRNLLSALRLEKTVMFIILSLIVLVACFNIASTLIMTVLEKTKDIGILKAIGANSGGIMRVFMLEGCAIGVVGTSLGAVLGLASCWLLKTYRFVTLPRDVYYIDRLPVSLEWLDVIVIVAASVAISLVSTVYPSYQASRLDPVEALRYE